MKQAVISITAIFLCAVYLLSPLVLKGKRALPIPLSAAVLSVAVLEFFDLLTMLHPEGLLYWKKFALMVEATLPPIWLWYTLTYARQNEPQSISHFQRLLLAVSPLFVCSILLLPITSFFYSPDFVSERVLFLNNAGFLFYLLLLIYIIIALINLEMTFVNANITSRWKIKFELLGTGAILSVMIFYYSQSLLFRSINMYYIPARTMLLIVAVTMMLYSRLKRGNGVKVYVSRQMMYKSVVLLVVGIYLMGLGVTGEGMKHFGDGFQRALVIALAFIGGLGLVVTLLSETIKRKVRVFIHKNFHQNKYDYRNQWLQFTDRLTSSKTGDELLQSIVMGFCDTFGMGCGALFQIDQDKDTYQKSADIAMESVTVVFCAGDPAIASIADQKWVADLQGKCSEFNDEQKRFFSANAISFLIPLSMNNGIDGFIVMGKPINKDETYNYEDFDLMKTLARQAASALLNLRLSDQLARSREMAAIGRVSTFVLHDLKNLVSAMSLMFENAKEYIAVPEFQAELLTSLDNTVAKMNVLISRLKHLPEKDSLQRTPVNLLQLAYDTAALVRSRKFRVTGTSVIAEVDRNEFQKVALNLMLNAAEATEGTGSVLVEVGGTEAAYFRVKDEGCGISDYFLRHHIFTPFKTTKKEGLGIGLYQCKQIVEAHGGKIEVVSELSRGSEFTVWLPKINHNPI